jgi:hypothetical protein
MKKDWLGICNRIYSEGRDQEDYSLKQTQANNSWDPILKKPITKRKEVWCMTQGVGPKFKPQYCKKKNKTEKLFHIKWD